MHTALTLLGALALVVLASDAFTNAVEWIGALAGLTRSAAGAVVAAIGSSLPETVVAFVALVLLRDPASQAIGIGAVIGAPFMLATFVFGLVGVIALARSRRQTNAVQADAGTASFGLGLFCCTFALVIGASFAPTLPVRVIASIAVLAAYVWYIAHHVRLRGPESDEHPPRLRFWPQAARPPLPMVWLQLAVAAIVTLIAARWFVDAAAATAIALAVPALLVSLVLSPIATELPEIVNVSMWMRRGQDELALGNVIGAMMFQTSTASAIAMLASPWHLDPSAYAAALAALVAAAFALLWTLVRRRVEAWPLALCAFGYVAYIGWVFLRR